ncbi:F0F1 ATP synthase subunit B' [Celeribacter arenosi]|uniref:ATP synthase subunit b n=1 Tax=Celeribacter arenosi TaxID=792649 RepID=A0ABP7K7M0_9RHOB
MATETHGADTQVADVAHGAAESVGMPQLDIATFPNQIFWLLVTLVVIYFLLSKIALPRISSVLAERSGTIMNDIAAAEELKLKAADAEKAYDAALAEAKAEAHRISLETRAGIQAELDVATAKADAQIAAKAAESEKAIAEIRDGAIESVKEVANDTAKEIIAALGSSADARTITAAINARLKG